MATATKIGNTYDWPFILKLLKERVFVGDEVLEKDLSGLANPKSYVCSSLYSTAHAYVTDVSLTDKTNGMCVPAYLAKQGRHLTTVNFSWKRINAN